MVLEGESGGGAIHFGGGGVSVRVKGAEWRVESETRKMVMMSEKVVAEAGT